MANGVILGQTLNTNNLLPLDGSRAMTGALNMGNHKITNVANGTNANDAVNFNQLNTSTIQASRISGVLGTSNIPNLAASKITSGTFNTARIPNLSASKITSGILPVGRGGTGVSNLNDLMESVNNIAKKNINYSIASRDREYIITANTNWMMNNALPYIMSVFVDGSATMYIDNKSYGLCVNVNNLFYIAAEPDPYDNYMINYLCLYYYNMIQSVSGGFDPLTTLYNIPTSTVDLNNGILYTRYGVQIGNNSSTTINGRISLYYF